MQTKNPNVIELGRKQFTPIVNSTVEHDYYMLDSVRAAGLDSILVDSDLDAEQFVQELLKTVASSGYLFKLLGGLIMPKGMRGPDWTIETANETADFIKKLSEPADKLRIHQLVVEMILSFFETGLSRCVVSQSSSPTVPTVLSATQATQLQIEAQ